MEFKWIRSLVVASDFAVPVHAAAEAPALNYLLEKLGAWAIVTNAPPPLRPGPAFVLPSNPRRNMCARAFGTRCPPSGYRTARSASRLMKPVEIKRQGDQLALSLRRSSLPGAILKPCEWREWSRPIQSMSTPRPSWRRQSCHNSGAPNSAAGLPVKAVRWRATHQRFQHYRTTAEAWKRWHHTGLPPVRRHAS